MDPNIIMKNMTKDMQSPFGYRLENVIWFETFSLQSLILPGKGPPVWPLGIKPSFQLENYMLKSHPNF